MTLRQQLLNDSAFTEHFIERCKQRGITAKLINAIVLTGRIRIQLDGTFVFRKDGIAVVINPTEKVYITAYAEGKRRGELK